MAVIFIELRTNIRAMRQHCVQRFRAKNCRGVKPEHLSHGKI